MEKYILQETKGILQAAFLFYLIYKYEIEMMMGFYYITFCFSMEIITIWFRWIRIREKLNLYNLSRSTE